MKHHKFNSDEIGWYILLRIRIRSCLCSEVGPGSRSKPDRIRNTRRDQVKLEVFFSEKPYIFASRSVIDNEALCKPRNGSGISCEAGDGDAHVVINHKNLLLMS